MSTKLMVALTIVVLTSCDRLPTPASQAPKTAPTTVVAPTTAQVPPPVDAPTSQLVWHTVISADGGFTVRYAFEPDPIKTRDPFSINVELFEDPACTKPLAGGTLSVDASMPEHGHGMNVRPRVTDRGVGKSLVEGMLFHMPGRWELFFDRTVDGQTERAQTTVRLDFGT